MDEDLLTALKEQYRGEIARLRADIDVDRDRHREREAELLDENRRLWAAVAHLKEAVGTYDATVREAFARGESPGDDRADEANTCALVADELIGGLVPLTPAGGRAEP